MTSRVSSDFRRDLARLPERARRQAREAYRLFKANPHHPSLKFKKLPASRKPVVGTNDQRVSRHRMLAG